MTALVRGGGGRKKEDGRGGVGYDIAGGHDTAKRLPAFHYFGFQTASSVGEDNPA